MKVKAEAAKPGEPKFPYLAEHNSEGVVLVVASVGPGSDMRQIVLLEGSKHADWIVASAPVNRVLYHTHVINLTPITQPVVLEND